MSVAYFEEQRREMIAAIRVIAEHLVAEMGKTALDDRVLRAMAKVPRHEFVPIEVQPYAYLNRPLPIGFDKTISQPLMVAVMTDLLELKLDDLVSEWHVRDRRRLAHRAEQRLTKLKGGERMVIPVGLTSAACRGNKDVNGSGRMQRSW